MLNKAKRQGIVIGAVLAAVILLLALGQVAAVNAATASASVLGLGQDDGPAGPALAEAIEAAVTWLVETHQNADGGFSNFSTGADQAPSEIGGTLDALWALGVSEADTGPAIAYMLSNTDELAAYVSQDGSQAAKALLALAAEEDVSSAGGLDLAANLTNHLSPTGQYGVDTAFNQSLAMLGLAFSGYSTAEEAATWLAEQQENEGELAGSWDDGFGTAGNADSTALAIAALLANGKSREDPVIVAGREFLAQTQLDSGGWEYGAGFGESANSTALVLLALAMLGEDVVNEASDWAKDGRTPMAALLAWQGESGAFQADFGGGRQDDFFSTAQTIPALAYSQALLGRLLQAPVVDAASEDAPLEMTPTATPAEAAEPTATVAAATVAAATVAPEPTEAPLTATPEAVSEAEVDDTSATDDSTTAEAEAQEPAEDEGSSSILPWVIGIGALVVVAGLVWWLISRRKEA
jgi:hypothetical protein